MGNTGNKSEGGNEYKKLMDNYEIKKKIQDERFGEATILEEKSTKEEILLRELTSTNDATFEKENQKYQERMKIKHPNVLQLIGCTSKSENQFCSTFFKTYLLFEFANNNLNRELFERERIHNPFSEEEIWYLIESVANGLSFLEKMKIPHGDVIPANIYISKTGVYKIAEQSLLNQNSSFIQLFSQSMTHPKNVYVSPQLMKALEHKQMQPKHNVFKSDVYSFGMTLLHSGSLESCDLIYDYKNFKINEKLIDDRLKIIGMRYSPKLVNYIKTLLNNDEDSRPDLTTALQLIKVPVNTTTSSQQSASINNYDLSSTSTTIIAGDTRNVYQEEQMKRAGMRIDQRGDSYNKLYNQNGAGHSSQQYSYGYSANNTNSNINNNLGGREENIVKQYSVIEKKNEILPPTSTNDYFASNYGGSSSHLIGGTSSMQPDLGVKKEETRVSTFGDINYDDINALLKKYGIEPIQPRTQVNYSSPTDTIKLEEKKSSGAYDYNAWPSYSGVSSNAQGLGGLQSNPASSYTTTSYSVYSKMEEPKNTYSGYTKYEELTKPFDHTSGYSRESNTRFEPLKQYGAFESSSNYLGTQPNFKQEDSYRSPLPLDTYSLTSEKREKVFENYQNGSRYEGEKVGGLRHGSGKFFYSDGGVYDGQWRNNKMHGKGVLYYASGKPAYDGDWVDDKFEGRGILYNEVPQELRVPFDFQDFEVIDDFWSQYEGGFSDDSKDGYGVLYLTNGERFVGNFKGDAINGQGVFYKKDNSQISGVWINNRLAN